MMSRPTKLAWFLWDNIVALLAVAALLALIAFVGVAILKALEII